MTDPFPARRWALKGGRKMKISYYKFVWKDGQEQVGHGTGPGHALTSLGYGGGAVAALDYWKKITKKEHDEILKAEEER
jgi:hypothetical protein